MNDWIPITTLPNCDDNLFSDVLELKIKGRKCRGYYDQYKEQWWQTFTPDWKESKIVTPTHWREINKLKP